MKKIQTVTFTVLLLILLPACSLLSKPDSSGRSSTDSAAGAQICISMYGCSSGGTARTVVPDTTTSFPVISYTVTAVNGSTTKTYTANSSGASDSDTLSNLTAFAYETSISMNLTPGTWSLSVQGYNGVNGTGNEICSNSSANSDTITVVKTSSSAADSDSGSGAATVYMYPSDTGSGTVNLTLTAPSGVTGAAATITGPGSTAAAYTLDAAETAGSSTNTFTFTNDSAHSTYPSGSYSLVVLLTENSSVVYRRTETLYIWPGFVTDTWIVHTSPDSVSCSTLTVSSSDIAGTDTSFTTLSAAQTASSLFETYSSSDIIKAGYARFFCDSSSVCSCTLTLQPGQSAAVKTAAGTSLTPAVTGDSNSQYVLTYTLPAYTINDLADITVGSVNQDKSHTYRLAYGGSAVSGTGDDTDGDGTRSCPFKTITKAAGKLTYADNEAYAPYNRIELNSDITENVSFPLSGQNAFYGILSGVNRADSTGTVHTLTGSGTEAAVTVDAGASLTVADAAVTCAGAGYAADVKDGGTLILSGATALQSLSAAAGSTVRFCGSAAVTGRVSAAAGENGAELIADVSSLTGSGTIARITPSEYPSSVASSPVLYAADTSAPLTKAVCKRFPVTAVPVTGTADNEYYVMYKEDSSGTAYGYIALRGVYLSVSYTDTGLTSIVLGCSTTTYTNGNNSVIVLDTTQIDEATAKALTVNSMGLYTSGSEQTETATGTEIDNIWSVSCSNITPGKYQLIVKGLLSGTAWSAEKTVTITYAEKE
jgi:hypothetical protein